LIEREELAGLTVVMLWRYAAIAVGISIYPYPFDRRVKPGYYARASDQYKVLLTVILLGLKPALTQERPEMERAFDAVLPKIAEAYAPFYSALVDAAATVYANNFSVDDLREIETFYSRPAGKKLLEKSQAIAQQNTQVGQETGRKASEALRARLAKLLRQTAH
jgi:hypothetical protein